MLIDSINRMDSSKNYLIYFHSPNTLENDVQNANVICLNKMGKGGNLFAILLLRKLINKYKADVLHAHSYWTNIVSRVAAPENVKVINHYHFADYDTMKDKKSVRRMIVLDRLTERKLLTRVGVSKYVERILNSTFPKGKNVCVPNFVLGEEAINRVVNYYSKEQLNMVAVGTIKSEKNYSFYIEAFNGLRDFPVSIDIYGGGDSLAQYRQRVSALKLDNIRFKGEVANVPQVLDKYNLFTSASTSETFGIALMEGVRAGLPLLVSDIPAFKEVAPKSAATFFNPYDVGDFIDKVKSILEAKLIPSLSDYNSCLKTYSVDTYLAKIADLYR
nr:glycosyltransferase [Niabella pedocola]